MNQSGLLTVDLQTLIVDEKENRLGSAFVENMQTIDDLLNSVRPNG
jgi:hypothetical protein